MKYHISLIIKIMGMINFLKYILLSFLFISCGSNQFVMNSNNKPRPIFDYKFHLDKKKNSVTDINSVIDTNSIYLSTSFRRMKKGIKGIFYRFLPNGVVYEVVLREGELIKYAAEDSTKGNYGKYRIGKKNKIKMEFMALIEDPRDRNKKVATNYLKFAQIKGDNLFLNPREYSDTREGYKLLGSMREGAILFAPFIIADAFIYNGEVCFYRVDIKNLNTYLANHQ